MTSPSLTTTRTDAELLAFDLDRFGADHRGRAPTAGNDRGVADEPAASGEDAFADHHAVNVFGAGLVADEDDLLASLRRQIGVVGGEVDLADGSARRSGQALGQHLALAGELRVEHLIEVIGSDAHERLVAW